ncbi:NAP1-related protein 2-like isoform X1 [Zingiber officinale]|uniref:NAP1-related protein 2-like isoform X1 n=1 Tax=Zingiber officinale TaxID=94328 RepID=UPI001C4D1727|nr:NAP1-related protein 2-like isoform X1 [Zingiber officinale]
MQKGLATRMTVADKGKKSKFEEEGTDHIDGELVVSIEKLQDIQDEIEKVNEEASDKVLEVEQKYNEIRRPIYSRRNEIILSIPDFWLTAFLSHPVIADLITEEDQKILKYLISLNVEDFKDVKSGYSITFNFSPNPYFEDSSLTKTYSFFDEGITNITGTTIEWKEGMNVANGGVHEKERGKRPFSEESFFSWFSETQQKNLAEGFSDEVAEILKEDLWPNPLRRLTMKILREMMMMMRKDLTSTMRMNQEATKMVKQTALKWKTSSYADHLST